MKLFSYFRSSAAWRVRIGLALKGIEHEAVFVHLRRREHEAAGYADINPQRLVPTLVDGADVLVQSLAILEYLEETRAQPPILPADAAGRARVRALALAVACDIHPVNNLRVLTYLTGELGLGEEARDAWYRHWIAEGFAAIEKLLARSPETGPFCHGETPTIADICLIPQAFNARRFSCDLEPYPTIRRIEAACLALPAFADTAPDRQPDADGP
jgi:maleylacetoacetate isomerase